LPVPGRGHPSGRLVRRVQLGQRGLAALAVRARRRVRLGLGHPLLPAAPAGRLVLAVPRGQPAPAPRLGPGDRRVLVGLVRPEGQPDQLGQEGQPAQQALEDPAVPSKPLMRSSRWQQEWSPPVALAPRRSIAVKQIARAVAQEIIELPNLTSRGSCGRCSGRDCHSLYTQRPPGSLAERPFG
jgi:hypothetical protein